MLNMRIYTGLFLTSNLLLFKLEVICILKIAIEWVYFICFNLQLILINYGNCWSMYFSLTM